MTTAAAAVCDFVVKRYDMYEAHPSRGAEPEQKDDPERTSKIPYQARRRPQCTVVLPAPLT